MNSSSSSPCSISYGDDASEHMLGVGEPVEDCPPTGYEFSSSPCDVDPSDGVSPSSSFSLLIYSTADRNVSTLLIFLFLDE